MTQYIEIIAGFLGGGGLMIILNYRMNKKIQKIDFADKAIFFLESQNDKYTARIERLEKDVEKLFQFKCENINCKNRKPPREV